MMKTITKKVTNSKECETKEQYDLQIKLKEALTGKKFLFVVDNICDEYPHKWDVLKSSFESGLYEARSRDYMQQSCCISYENQVSSI